LQEASLAIDRSRRDKGFMRFLTDRMLGRLSSWLRILGYDTISANSFSGLSNAEEDTYMLKLSSLEQRILLTRDTQLHRRAKERHGVSALFVEDGDVVRQLNQVRQCFGLVFPGEPNVLRCTVCNGNIQSATSADVRHSSEISSLRSRGVDIDKFVQRYAEFYKCKQCGKIFWKGGHWRQIVQKIHTLNSQASISLSNESGLKIPL